MSPARPTSPRPAPPRTGARRRADIPPETLAALERGELESATLAEGLALNHARLLAAAFPELPARARAEAEAAGELGILKRMGRLAAILLEHLGPAAWPRCLAHPSDTVRGWGGFVLAALPDLPLAARLDAVRPLADDPHFGVREWAWLALRPRLAAQLPAAIAALAAWTAEPSERLRRFASESLRPRGVWCAHIPELKADPGQGLPLLDPLRADPSAYVQDSVGNWLNDAGKDRPDWVRELCGRWLAGDPPEAARRICRRGLRNLT